MNIRNMSILVCVCVYMCVQMVQENPNFTWPRVQWLMGEQSILTCTHFNTGKLSNVADTYKTFQPYMRVYTDKHTVFSYLPLVFGDLLFLLSFVLYLLSYNYHYYGSLIILIMAWMTHLTYVNDIIIEQHHHNQK